MPEGPDYENIIHNQRIYNIEQVQSYLDIPCKDQDNLYKRIATFISGTNFSKEEVIKEIRKNQMFAATFAVDPRKQNIDENVAKVWLASQPLIKNLKKLPTSKKDGLFVSSDGDILSGRASKGE